MIVLLGVSYGFWNHKNACLVELDSNVPQSFTRLSYRTGWLFRRIKVRLETASKVVKWLGPDLHVAVAHLLQ